MDPRQGYILGPNNDLYVWHDVGTCMQDIKRHTFSNKVTSYRLLGSRCNKCAVVKPAIPVPMTATVLGLGEWAFSMAEKGCTLVANARETKIRA